MNIENYSELKEKGLISIAIAGDAYTISRKRFSVDTGEELPPEVEALDILQLESEKDGLLHQLSEIDNLIKDIKHLKG